MVPPTRVLVVDDDEAICASIAGQLAGLGMLATCVDGAATALTLCDVECPFDIVLADVSMPGMDGVQLAQTLRRKHPTVPVILMTGRESVVEARSKPGPCHSSSRSARFNSRP